MTAGFFIDDPVGRWAAALLCYVGIVLYAANAGIRGLRRGPQEAVVTAVFAGLLPISSAPAIVYTAQFVLFLLGLSVLGMLQVQFALLRNRAVRAYEAGRQTEAVGALTWLMTAAPGLLAAGYPIAGAIKELVRSGRWNESIGGVELSEQAAQGLWYILLAVVVYGGYMAAAWRLDQAWLRSVGRIRLLSADARFVWINLAMGVVAVLAVSAMVAFGSANARGFALIVTLALALVPGINGLSWVYDAAFRRVVILHLLFAVGAVLVFGIHAVAARLGVPSSVAWWTALAAAVCIAVVLPARLDALLERFFFPRSGRMRARLVEIATEPLRSSTRADAGAELLERLVHLLDSDGGIFIAERAASEPAVLRCVGRVEPQALGASATDVASYVAALPLQKGPCGIEDLPLEHQPRLLEAGAVFACRLPGRRTEATLLLGPRRGWLYDVATVRTMRVFASQAGLALENLLLATARAHADKLAALGEAAARIAHEIRNPLSAARSLMQLAGDADGVGDLTAPAIGELDRIGQLVTDLLAFARRDETMSRAPVDLSGVCRIALNQVASLAETAAVEVETSIAVATVDGDANRLVQVIANLCRNAIEALATSTAPRRLAVRCTTANGSACIEVSDTGPGIAAGDLARIFEPFATTKSAGTGLGLPIARRIVEAHGGGLSVESAPGGETVFRVSLPLATRA